MQDFIATIEDDRLKRRNQLKWSMEDLLELQHKLLDEALIFIRAASRMVGVTRIALIGSLTTDKVDPIEPVFAYYAPKSLTICCALSNNLRL